MVLVGLGKPRKENELDELVSNGEIKRHRRLGFRDFENFNLLLVSKAMMDNPLISYFFMIKSVEAQILSQI